MSVLLEPVDVGGVRLGNRIVMAAMTTRFADPDGHVTQQLIDYYAARAAGGVGLVTVELTSPHPSGRHRHREIGLHDDRFLPGLRRLVDAIHANGAKASIQIGHAGAHARPDVTGHPAVAPSDVAHVVREGDTVTVTPQPLDHAGITEIVEAYGAAAARAGRAGFDMVELQGAHDYLIFQFLSPLDNRRTDEYGGPPDRRARFAVEVITAVREHVGPDFPISFRISGDEFAEGGFTADDADIVVPLLTASGADLISVSGGSARSQPIPWLITTPMAYEPGLFVPLAARIKRRVDVPVAVAGRLHDPGFAERVVAGGYADLVVLGRALIADPAWPQKVAAGHRDRLRPCLACNTCVDHLRSGRQIRCVVNPTVGAEAAPALRPAAKPHTVVVIGGGPAGLTAATALASSGHHVTVLERGARLGGRLHDIPRAPYFQVVETAPGPFRQLQTYLVDSARSAGVDLQVGVNDVLGETLARAPDIAVLATGATYPIPGMLGLLRLPGARRLASLPRLRKLFFKLLRNRDDGLRDKLGAAGIGVLVAGDRSGSRGLEAAIRTGWETASTLPSADQEEAASG